MLPNYIREAAELVCLQDLSKILLASQKEKTIALWKFAFDVSNGPVNLPPWQPSTLYEQLANLLNDLGISH